MKRYYRSIAQVLLLATVAFLLIRFFPIVIQMTEAAALGIRAFWWMILVFALGGWLIWVLRKRNSG
mgnify:CR=1 FL=1